MKLIKLSCLYLSLLLFVLLIEQSLQQCSVNTWRGQCVKFADCAYTKSLSDRAINADDWNEIKQRSDACFVAGKGFVCCEKSGPSTITILVENPVKPIIEVHSSNDENLLEHRNYGFFKILQCGKSAIKDRVSGGNDTGLFQYPWAAQLGFDFLGELRYECGGTLISEYYVLTAAHCLVNLTTRKRLVQVRLGEWNTASMQDCDDSNPDRDPICAEPVQDVGVRSFVAHPEYTRSTLHNDIGLVQLSAGAKLNQKNIKAICLPFAEDLQQLPERLIVIGWGATEKSRGSAILQEASMPLYDQEKCQDKYTRQKVTLTNGQFCAGGEGRVDACKGDSGSSISYYQSINFKQRVVQYGVVSYGVRLCGVLEGFPGVYTKVTHYLKWILDNVQQVNIIPA